jgi:hypothetical protein
MATRREFVRSLPAVGTAFAIGGRLALDDGPAQAQGAAAPMTGHFHLLRSFALVASALAMEWAL